MDTIESISSLRPVLEEAAAIGMSYWSDPDIRLRGYKADRSIITKADIEINAFLIESLGKRFPRANVIGEEKSAPFEPEKSRTFAIDPIDGTDSFSLKLPGWAISLGLLDSSFRPVAGIVVVPAWDWTFFADVGRPAILVRNGRTIHLQDIVRKSEFLDVDPLDRGANLLVDSKNHRELCLPAYPGKARSFGSVALHLCMVTMHGAIVGCLGGPSHVWDFAGGHAVAASLGFEVRYLDGTGIDYRPLIDGSAARDSILCTHPARLERLLSVKWKPPGTSGGCPFP